MTPASAVVIVRTGAANLASVIAAFTRLTGSAPIVTNDPHIVRDAPGVVLPGVGAFGPAMERLREWNLVTPLRDRILQGAPTLAICLGLQLMARTSDESPGVEGLGVIDSHVGRFSGAVRVPQMGWNTVTPSTDFPLPAAGYAYFANSYRLTSCPYGWTAAWSDHDGPLVAAIQRDAVLACQFHPELSGAYGSSLLRAWLALFMREPAPC